MPSLWCARSATLLLCGLGLALGNALCAQGVGKEGTELALNGAKIGDQTFPNVAIGPGGGYVVWQDNAVDGPGKSFGIAARKLAADLAPSGLKFRVNGTIDAAQENPQVALMMNGGAAFVWQGGKLGGQDIYFRTLSPEGALTPTNDVRVNTHTARQQGAPVITCLSNGNLAVAWSSLHEDKHLQGVYARILTPAGQFASVPFQVNQFTSNNQRNPAITTLSNGHFVVVWLSENQGGMTTLDVLRGTNRVHVYARVFRKGGVPVGDEFRINTRSNLCSSPSVAPWGSTGFSVVWAEKTQNRTNSWDIYARSFSASAQPATDAVLVNSVTLGDQFAPRIASVGSHQLVIWNSLGHDGYREGVFGRFLRAGDVNGPEFLVNTVTHGSQIHPVVAGNRKDRFLVAWSGFMGPTSFDVRAQRYSAVEPPPDESTGGSGGSSGTGDPPSGGEPPPPPGTGGGGAGGSGSSTLRITLANTSKGKLLSWNTETGLVYQVQYSTNLSHWLNAGEPRPATETLDGVLIENGESAAFYRVIRLK